MIWVSVVSTLLAIALSLLVYSCLKNRKKTEDYATQVRMLKTAHNISHGLIFTCKKVGGLFIHDHSGGDILKLAKNYTIDGQSLEEFMPPELLVEARSYYEKAWTEQVEVSYEMAFPTERIYLTTLRPIIVGEKTDYIAGYVIDTTEVRKLYEMIATSIKRRQLILDKIAEIFLELDDRLNIVGCNQAISQLFSAPSEQLLGVNLAELFPGIEQTEYYENLLNVSRAQTTLEFRVYADMFGKWLDVRAFPTQSGMFLYANDVTQKKKLEDEVSRLGRLNLAGEMASAIAHEIRNPLTTVRGFLQMMQTHLTLPSEYHETFMPLMISELDRSNQILTEYLSLAKDKRVELSRQNLNDIISKILPLLESDSLLYRANLKTSMQPVPLIEIDENECKQLLFNFLRNSMESGEQPTIVLSTYVEGQHVVLDVRDTGNGFHPNVLERPGTPFLTTKDFGVGLGLAVCFRIAERHKATIELQNGETGAIVKVFFPIPQQILSQKSGIA
jgi:two-component system, sporulation sensor kinase E